MDGLLPDWLARWFGVEGAGGEHGVAWRLVEFWNWPAWATVLTILVAAGLILAAYRTEIGAARRRTRLMLSLARLAALLLVLGMLARWMLAIEQADLPTLAVAVDVSRSMDWPDGAAGASDPAGWRERLASLQIDRPTRLALAKSLLLDERRGLLDELERRYRVKLYLLADVAEAGDGTASPADRLKDAAPHGEHTRLGDSVRSILGDLEGRAVAALVLFSDGVTTDGRTLSEAAVLARRRNVPLFAVALGSEQPPQDVELVEVSAQDVVFAGDTMYFDVRLIARSLAGQSVRIVLRRAGSDEILAETSATLAGDDAQQWVHLPYRPEAPGQFRFIVSAEPLPDEHNAKNNRQERSVTVVKQQVRVLLVEGQPRYEYRFLKHLLEREPTIEVHSVLQSADLDYHRIDATALETLPVRREELFRYDVIVLGDVDPAYLGPSVVETLRDFVQERAGGIVFIAGERHMPAGYAGTPLDAIIPVDLASVVRSDGDLPFPEPLAVVPTEAGRGMPQMRLAETPEETARLWQALPPQFWYLTAPRLKGGALPLAEHATARSAQGEPLPLISTLHATWPGKTLFHAIDGTYLWRTAASEKYYARYWIQTIRFLAHTKLLGQDRRAELTADRRQYRRGTPVSIGLRFFAQQDAPPVGSQVSVAIESETERRTLTLEPVAMRRGGYSATLADLPEGAYRARLIAPALSGIVPTADFTVAPPPGEMDRLQVDLAELKTATQATSGKLYRLDGAAELADDLPPGRHAPTSRLPDISLWNSWPVPVAFLLLLVGEWIVRKRHGML